MKITASSIGHIILITLCILFFYQFVTAPHPWIFLDAINLVIHEAGHVIFSPFGEFMKILGGSLFQILFPCVFFFYFLKRGEYFSASFILFWIADNIVNVGVYMSDAQIMQLPLIGGEGVIHDWNWIFSYHHILSKAEAAGSIFFSIGLCGAFVGIAAMIWFTVLDLRQHADVTE